MIAAHQPDAFASQAAAPGEEQERGQRRRDSRRQPRREIVFAEKAITRDLRPINERRFVEAILVIEVRDDIIAPLPHLARRLGKTRLVSIDQRDDPGARDVEKQAADEEQNEITDCGWQSED